MPTTRSPRAAARPPHSAADAIRYEVRADDPAGHLLRVACELDRPSPQGEIFAMPAWIPGSYLIRDFCRHVVTFRALADGRPVAARKLAKDRWQIEGLAGCRTLRVELEVYAWDLSVRGAHFDASHAFFNGSSVFLRVEGRERQPCWLDLPAPRGRFARGWEVATAMTALQVSAAGFGRYAAADYHELIDHPFELGRFDRVRFTTRNVRHEIALTGRHQADLAQLARDVETVCRWHLDFWGAPAPIARYLFLVTAVGEGYGGLEHRASTALLCNRDSLPAAPARDGQAGEAYRGFLGLVSHEYFHTWLVKRIRPAEFDELDLQRENLTELLWLFEGFTSYYDDLALRRSGLISVDDYLATLARSVKAVLSAPGRFRQSVAEASRDAWIKYYRPDENSPNASVSYYAKGALVALLLDLRLREATAGQASLDVLMRRLWSESGRGERGIREADVRRLAREIAGRSLDRFFAEAVHGTGELPLARMLGRFGIEWHGADDGAASLGVRIETAAHGEARIACAVDGGAARAAGLSGGDVVIAIDGLRATASNLDRLVERHRVGATVEVHAFRRDELLRFTVTLRAATGNVRLARARRCSARAAALRAGWLGD